MKNNYKISLIIPTYNAEKTLENTIKSIINQTIGFKNIELILVDDNSNDRTHEIIQEYSNKYPNIIAIYNTTNSGSPSRPRNIGIKKATAEYIMFMDNDDHYYPDMCEVMYSKIIETNDDIVSCKSELNFIGNSKKTFVEKNRDNYLSKLGDIVHIDSIQENPKLVSTGDSTVIWNKIFNKKFIIENNIEFPEEELYEDIYFMAKAYINAKGITFLNNYTGYIYSIRNEKGNSSTSKTYSEKNLIKQYKGLKKIINLLDKYDGTYQSLEGEMIVGWTKLFIFTNLTNKKQKELLTNAKDIYINTINGIWN